jgi:hypothetical protein
MDTHTHRVDISRHCAGGLSDLGLAEHQTLLSSAPLKRQLVRNV